MTTFGWGCVAAATLCFIAAAAAGDWGWGCWAMLYASAAGPCVLASVSYLGRNLVRLPLGALGGPDPADPALATARGRYIARIGPVLLTYGAFAGAASLACGAVACGLAFEALPRWGFWPSVGIGWAAGASVFLPGGALGVLGGRWQGEERRRAGRQSEPAEPASVFSSRATVR